ncbi:ketopantoate reductase family protein [Desulfobacula sp.]|uniref:ketopantoate reductase family protein n=1 Tax=Desulfobacula sp. TaxID=2593537 RepID=UPI00261418DF|nr:2-dehydropantoate 2-reductase N-terminal domain-containing protein [Desulfobacula sp.]
MRIALLGVGSLGTALGGMISKSGQEIVLIDGYESHVKALNAKGATITGKMQLNADVKACLLNEIEGTFDIVFYLAKSTNNEVYLPAILPHLNDKSIVCTLQNGLPEELVSRFVGKERVIGGFVYWGASLVEPGVTEMTTEKDQLIYEIGEIDGGITPRLYRVKKILDLAGECLISENLMRVRWTKLSFNSAMSGMSAALGCTYGDVLNNEKAIVCAAFIKNEVLKIAHAQGINC